MKELYRDKVIVILLSVMVCLLLASCSSNSANDKFYQEDDPIQVTDCTGRKLSFEKPVQTIGTSQGGAVDNYFHALLVSDRIVATNGHHQVDKLYFDPDTMAQVGKWKVDKEALAEVHPDLYIGGIDTNDLKEANRIGIPAYGMGYNKFELITYNLSTLGVIFGVGDRAEYVVDYLNRIEQLIDERISQVPEDERPTAIMLSTVPGELSSKADTMAETMMEKAGCRSVVPDEYTKMPDKPIVGLEKIFDWNPDVIFFQDYDCELNPEKLYSDPLWQPMTAVQNKNVFEIPSVLDSWTKSDPACYLGLLYMCMQLYPDLFSDIDIEAYAVDFYKEVYGLTLTVEDIGIKKPQV